MGTHSPSSELNMFTPGDVGGPRQVEGELDTQCVPSMVALIARQGHSPGSRRLPSRRCPPTNIVVSAGAHRLILSGPRRTPSTKALEDLGEPGCIFDGKGSCVVYTVSLVACSG